MTNHAQTLPYCQYISNQKVRTIHVADNRTDQHFNASTLEQDDQFIILSQPNGDWLYSINLIQEIINHSLSTEQPRLLNNSDFIQLVNS